MGQITRKGPFSGQFIWLPSSHPTPNTLWKQLSFLNSGIYVSSCSSSIYLVSFVDSCHSSLCLPLNIGIPEVVFQPLFFSFFLLISSIHMIFYLLTYLCADDSQIYLDYICLLWQIQQSTRHLLMFHKYYKFENIWIWTHPSLLLYSYPCPHQKKEKLF